MFSTARALDWIYPAKCGLCGLASVRAICDVCEDRFERITTGPAVANELDFAYRTFEYTGRVAQAVKRLKYSRVTSLAVPMSEALAECAANLALPAETVVVPVPIHWSRRFHRGFNQSELLCRAFPASSVRAELLWRRRRTRPQARLSPMARLTNLEGAFEASPDVHGMRILLVDDVHTTGQTGVECAKALKANGASDVRLLAFAGEQG